MLRVLPCLDALDDEEALSRFDESEPARFPYERRVARGIGELALQLPLLRAEALNLAGALDERVARVDVRMQRPVIEEPHEAKCPHAEPAANEHAAPRSTAPRSALAF
jgi:hypothetical protein